MQVFSARNLVTLLALVALASQAAAQEQEWLSYYPSVARLNGKLIKVIKYGKPSYGEHPEKDQKVEVAILILQTPVRVKASPASSVNNEPATNVSFVQIIFPPELTASSTQHFDKNVLLAGNLVRGHKGDHFTEVVMNVKAINPTGKPLY